MNIEESAGATSALIWFKSSYSSNEGGECVEVATNSGTVLVRDSKDRKGPQLTFTAAEWTTFVSYAAGIGRIRSH